MPAAANHDPLDHLLRGLEQEILAAPDRDLTDSAVDRSLADQTRASIAQALTRRKPATRRSSVRTLTRGRERRDLVRQLLVASPRARDLAGPTGLEALSDEDVDAILARFAKAGLLPPAKP